MTALRWGFIGASRIGRRVLAPAVLAAGQTLHAVAARDAGRARDFADAFGAPRAYGGYEALLDDAEVDAVYIALTNDAHLTWTLRALAAGKHVLCEKPLAMNAGEVAAMAEAEQASGRMVLEAFAYRFNAQVARLREVLRARPLGRIVAAQVTFGNTMADGDFRWTASLGGGALYDIGCYCVDLLRLVLEEEPTRVIAVQRTRGAAGEAVDATMAALMECPSGAVAQFTCSFDTARGQHLAVLGSDGVLALDVPFAPSAPVATLTVNGVAETFGPSEPYRGMVEHFAAAIAGHTPLRHGLAHSLAQARVLDALFASARADGQPVAP